MKHLLTIAITALALVGTSKSAAAEDINGARGKIFNPNQAEKSFELLKETVFDPQTNEGKSRHTVYWDDDTKFTKLVTTNDFTGVKGPVVALFEDLAEGNARAAAEGKPFQAMSVTLYPQAKATDDISAGENGLVAWFTPDSDSEHPRSGTVKIAGKPVKITLSRRVQMTKVTTRIPAIAEDLDKGFWEAVLTGAEEDGRFVCDSVDITPLLDPRTVDDPKLPRVLVVGDSISMNYHEAAKAALAGKANYYRVEGNGGPSDRGVACMELWLGDYKQKGLHWDVIQFNHGLHDLKQPYDKETDTWGEHQVSIEDYKKNLEKEIAIMKKTGATLIWCSTTPVPNSNKGTYARRKGEAAVFNKAAMEVVGKHPEILVNDLHKFIAENKAFDKWRTGVDVHFWGKEEQDLVGAAVADAITKALQQRAAPKKNLPMPGEVFSVEGKTAFLILPEKTEAGKPIPWVWYAPTLPGLPGKAETWMFEKFLANGIAIAGVDVGESYGSPKGRAVYSALYNELVENRGLAKKACLLARSRGGLMLYCWAAENPDAVACVAGIYPVCNIASYPGLGRACGAYGMTEEQLAEKLTEHNPIDRLAPLAKAGVPILHIHGDKDSVVPLEKNSAELKKRYDKLGGKMTLEIVEGQGHNMWTGWFTNQKLVDFVVEHAR